MEIKHLMGWIAGHAGSLAIYYGTGQIRRSRWSCCSPGTACAAAHRLPTTRWGKSWTASRSYIGRTATEPEFRPVNQVISFLFR